MGVDAEMIVRIKGKENWLDEKDLIRTAYEMASTLGHDNYFITLGDNKTYGTPHHALSIIQPIKTKEEAEYNGIEESLIGKTVFTQDGPDILAEEDEQFIKVHFWTRYYSEDYARGNWPVIRDTADWLRLKFPKGEVLYGGDSSGMCAEVLTVERQKELNDFYLKDGGKSYYRRGFGFMEKHNAPTCPCCKEPMFSFGGGGNTTFWNCDGCGMKSLTGLQPNPIFNRVKEITKWLDEERAKAA